ncbi:acylneuraminate cytidylyltransferase family protein [Algoriphagus sp.]|uniref:acylneuraminate cytidylyltransferase family protein n=1 Tax=Algoriphagus sp. TaxID=1872435 RepID=UPI0025E19DC1|nr:acylneuraminate cytidylyltransferase family protein [Algoriphagus sp.]
MNYQIVIPARGGSKRFVGKNIIDLNGIPLIAHSINFARQNFPENDVFVNTDTEEIAKIARGFGAKITMRPESLGSDTTSSVEVLQQQLSWFESNEILCDAIILLQATNPIRPKNLLKEAISRFESSNRKSLAGFSVLPKKFGTIDESNFYHPENYLPGQRMQDLTPRYFENGLIYITLAEAIKNGEIITRDVYPLQIDHIASTVDIDEPDDLTYAAYILEHLKSYE